MRRWAMAIAMLLAVACGGSPPARFVFERDIGDWTYRRYQRVLDVETPIAGNPAVGHTATYIQRPDSRRDAVPFVTVFVTVYDQAPGLAAEVRRTMRDLASYDVEVRPIAGAFTWYLDGGPGDRWVLWVSQNRVVKVGASDELPDVPVSVVAQYLGPYPSDLDQFGRARPGTRSAGEREEEAPTEEPTEDEELPTYLRENAPR